MNEIMIFNELLNRAILASNLGKQQYGGDRDIYSALGYKTDITFADYYTRYQRQDIAKAIIDRPVNATWSGDIEVSDGDDSVDTPFEKEWDILCKTFKIKSVLKRLDKLTGIGRFGILLLGLDDVKTPDNMKTAVTGKRKLVYLKPFSEASVIISSWERDPTNSRYGLPLVYDITVSDAEEQTKTFAVHYSRVIHVAEDNLDSEVYGTPRLQSVFNRLMDMEKLVGGDAEMFWRGARPGYQGVLKDDYQMPTEVLEELKTQIKEYEHDLRRILINEGVELKSLAQQIADPKNHVDILIQMICSEKGIPKRILTGSERGELSSTQDKNEWDLFVSNRRTEQVEPLIVRPLVQRLIDFGIIAKPQDDNWVVKWDELFSVSEKERAEIGKLRAETLKAYADSPTAESIMSPEMFFELIMDYDTDEIDKITGSVEVDGNNGIQEEIKLMPVNGQ